MLTQVTMLLLLTVITKTKSPAQTGLFFKRGNNMNYAQYVNIKQGSKSLHRFSQGNTLPLIQRPFGFAAFSLQTETSRGSWYYHPEDKDLPVEQRRPHPRFPNRAQDRAEAEAFFLALANADIEHIAIENPVGIMNTKFRKPDQVVQPYFFGDAASKSTCLWLKNLPLLVPTEMVDKGEYIEFKSGKRIPKWYSDGFTKTKTPEERQKWRSKTF